MIQKLGVGHAVLEQIAADRGKPNDVGPWFRVQEEVGALRHFVLAQIRNDKLLPVQLVSAFYASGQNRVALCRIAANDEHESRVLNIPDGAGVTAIAHGSKQSLRRRRLAVA